MVAVLTLVMGLSMTSCLDTENSGTAWDMYGIFRIYNTYGTYFLKDSGGNSYYPTAASQAQLEAQGFRLSENNMIFAYVKFVEEETTTKADNTDNTPITRDVELLSVMPLDGEEVEVSSTKEVMEMDVPETAPIVTVDFSSYTSTDVGVLIAKPLLFDLETLLIPVRFNLSNSNELFQKHKLVLACSMDEMTEGSTDLVFYLRHDKGEDDGISYITDQTLGYNISNAVSNFRMLTGVEQPTKIIIKTHEDANQTGEIPEEYTTYEIEYKLSSEN